MKIIAEKIKTINWVDSFLLILFLLHFRQGISTIWFTFTRKEFYENGIAFLCVSILFVFIVFLKKHTAIFINPLIPFFTLIAVLLLYTMNALFFKLSIAPAILFLLGIYSILGFYLDQKIWRRSIFIFLILVLCLPLLERVQKFLGFPIRIVTAQAVSFLLQITGIGTISQAAVIITENHATSIDLPCSGVKSMYTGTLYILALFYLQKVRLSLKLLLLSVIFFFTLFLFNTWRVFSLVYIYDVLDMRQFGDFVHVFLGVVGFFISCTIIWFLIHKYVPSSPSEKKLNSKTLSQRSRHIKKFLLFVLSTLLLLHFLFVKEQIKPLHTVQIEKSYTLPHITLSELAFTQKEKDYFVTSDVEFSKKFYGKTTHAIPFTLLIVSSKSARTHHDPEICLQGLGHSINKSEIFQIDTFRIRKLSLNDNKATALYWFVGKKKNLLDYSERVWEEVTDPNQTWILITIGFSSPIDVSSNDIQDLIQQINAATKTLLLHP